MTVSHNNPAIYLSMHSFSSAPPIQGRQDPIPAAIGQNNSQNKWINIVDHFKGDHSKKLKPSKQSPQQPLTESCPSQPKTNLFSVR